MWGSEAARLQVGRERDGDGAEDGVARLRLPLVLRDDVLERDLSQLVHLRAHSPPSAEHAWGTPGSVKSPLAAAAAGPAKDPCLTRVCAPSKPSHVLRRSFWELRRDRAGLGAHPKP